MRVGDFKGHWALVTGASAGIGAEFCRRLASSGINLVMVARRAEALGELAAALTAAHGIRTLVVPIDLSERESASRVKAATDDAKVRISLLVNNAGSGFWGSFEKTQVDTYERMMQLNAATPISLCHLYRPDLESHPPAAIINVSSPAALQPMPYLAAYSASKACLHNFSLALYGEWQSRGILIQTLLPCPTHSEFDLKAGAYATGLSDERRDPAEVVDESLRQLETGAPFVTTQRGIYKQRVFAGIAPIKMIIREVKKMFEAPPGR